MTLESNTHPHDDLAVYALDALDPDERRAIDVHLAGCAPCRAELARHLDTLAQITTPEEPPPHLWDGIADALPSAGPRGSGSGDMGDVVPLEAVPRHAARRTRIRTPRTAWLAAVAAAAAVLVGVVAVSLRSSQERADVTDLAQAAIDEPDSTIVRLTGSGGAPQARVVLTGEGTGFVLLDALPRLPSGRSYQLWKMNGTEPPISLGVIGDGSADAAAFALPSDTSSFAITEEPDGGVPSPTGPVVADGERA